MNKKLGIFAVLLCLLGCTGIIDTEMAAAPSEDWYPEIRGVVLYPTLKPATGASIHLFPKDFMPDTGRASMWNASLATVCDSSGAFNLPGLPFGSYRLVAKDTLSGWVAFVVLDTAYLKPPGALSGLAVPADTAGWSGSKVLLTGSPFAILSDSTGRFLLPGIPEGVISLYYQRRLISGSDPVLYHHDSLITIVPGETTWVGNIGGK